MFNPYRYLLPTLYLSVIDIVNPDLLMCGCRTWISLVSSRTSGKSTKFFFYGVESQLCAATLAHYSTEPQTTGSDFEPLILLIAKSGIVHPNLGPHTKYPCSVYFKNVTSHYYIADTPGSTPPVKRVCYADDITVWASGSKIPQLESMINS